MSLTIRDERLRAVWTNLELAGCDISSYPACNLGNLRYRSPEAASKFEDKYSQAMDVYAFGCLLLKLVFPNLDPFSGSNDERVLETLESSWDSRKAEDRFVYVPELLHIEDRRLLELVKGCLMVSPASRSSIWDVIFSLSTLCGLDGQSEVRDQIEKCSVLASANFLSCVKSRYDVAEYSMDVDFLRLGQLRC